MVKIRTLTEMILITPEIILTLSYTFNESNNFYIPLYQQWASLSLHSHVVVNQFQVHFVNNFIQNSLVVLVYQTAFYHILNGNLTIIIIYMLVW